MGDIPVVKSISHGQRFGLAILAAALVFGMPMPRASAQLTTGTVTGTVLDPQAAAVAGVTVNLISESRGTRLPEAFTTNSGDFVIPNIPPDTYTVEIAHKGFKTLRRTGVAVSPGDRIGLGNLTIEVGAVTEAVTVTAEAALLQTQSAERSFTVTSTAVENLPISNRSFTSLASLTPGVDGTIRLGDRQASYGNDTNLMMDGVSTMDTGNNGFMFVVNTESIAEVKILVSSYQAEYGRSSGLQMSGVTKSGSNQFHGTGFAILRKSNWNAWNKGTKINGDTRTAIDEKDLGFSVGGPVGKPGGNNKLFFFYSHEIDPRSTGGGTIRYRFPTALERAGNFSQTTDNQGNPYPWIKDPLSSNPCTSTNASGCFPGSIIPADRQYSLGPKILGLYPMPNLPTTPGVNYNWQGTRPNQSMKSQEPVIKLDYQPWQKLRVSGKLALWGQPNQTIYDTLPGFNDSQQYKKWFSLFASTINYSLSPTMFLEGTFGMSRNDLAGCVQGQGGTGPTFCTSGLPMNDVASLKGAGLTGLPMIYPDAGVIDKNYYAYEALNAVKPPIWDGSRLSMVPQFGFGGRVANGPPNFPFPGWLNVNKTSDLSISVTKLQGRHTLKGGFYLTHSYKAQQRQGWAGNIDFGNNTQNSLDTGFGYANALMGIFSSYNQYSRYVEGNFIYNNIEGYIQDNFKLSPRLTLDYGVRLVHQQPQYDKLGQGVNWLPEKWALSAAPMLYTAGCAVATPPGQACPSASRQAKDPRTGQLLGPNTSVAIGTLIPGSGNVQNGIFKSGEGSIPATTYNWPTLRLGPRFGASWDVTGKQKLVIRGGGGLMFDRVAGNSVYDQIQNPPTLNNVTLRYSQLATMSGLTTQAAPGLNVYQLETGLPSTWTWNIGAQYLLPGATVLDAAYTGQHSYNLVEGVGINNLDFGAAFLPQNQDPTVTSSLPGGAVMNSDIIRPFRGFGGITQVQPRGVYNSHALLVSLTRRFAKGLTFGLNDSVMLQSKGNTGARIQHNPDGTFSERADQKQADELLGNYIGTRHRLKGNFVWNVPSMKNSGFLLKMVTSDWNLSGIWTGTTGGAYTIGTSFQNGAGNVNITGSGSYGYRTRIIGEPGGGCRTNDPYHQFNTSSFAPPEVGSVGLESGQDYLRGCWYQQTDLALQREIRFGEQRRISVRVDAFNVLNQSHITGRNTNMNVVSQSDATITNLPFDASGNLIATRSQPKNAGFGVVNGYQGGRSLQLWVRLTF